MGLIVRTAGSNKTKNEINYDLESLINSWNSIKDIAINSVAPSLIHQESEIIKRTEICMMKILTTLLLKEMKDIKLNHL